MAAMRVICSWIMTGMLGAAPLLAQDDLPRRAPGRALDFEPQLMLEHPGAIPSDPDAPAHSPEAEAARLEAVLVKARQRVAESEQLYKEGILARVEVEGRSLRILEVEKELAETRLQIAAAQRDTAKKSFDGHRIGQEELDKAESDWKATQEVAQAAEAKWDQAQLEAAALDLKRKRKLFAEGVGTRREVQLAEDRVALLTGTGGKP